MPISDEIIELAPVKKTKKIVIIMIVLSALFLAAAAAMLVLYLLKPSAVVSEGSIDGVRITESTTLFSSIDENGDPILTASVGKPYTVYATINLKGKMSAEIVWLIECNGKKVDSTAVFADTKSGIADSKSVANADAVSGSDDSDVKRYTYFFTFTPNGAHAGEKITVSAVSQENTAKSDKITFTVVEQATEHIFFTRYRGATTGNRDVDINGDKLNLPVYISSSNNSQYVVSFTQKGKAGVKENEYAEISVNSETQSNAVRVTSSNTNVIDSISYNYTASTFAFTIKSAGETNIIVTANVNRQGAPEVRATLHVVAQSSGELGYIEAIYFTDKPVTEKFFEANWTDASLGRVPKDADGIKVSTTLTLPYNEVAPYNDVLKHVVLLPFTLQCTKTGEGNAAKYEFKKDESWKNKIKIASSDSAICNVIETRPNNIKNYGLTCRGLSTGSQCTLTITDESSGAVASACRVLLSVLAPSGESDLVMSLSLGGQTYDDKALAASAAGGNKAITVSQGVEATLTVTYTFTAPKTADVSTLADRYISNTYLMTLSETGFLKAMLKKEGDVSLTKENKFTSENFTVKAVAGSPATKNFTGTAEFKLTIGDEGVVENGSYYYLNFTKIGLPITTVDPDVERTIGFYVSEVATAANLVDEETGRSVVTAEGRAGDFVKKSNTECDIYIQVQKEGSLTDLIDFYDLIKPNKGAYNITGRIQSNSSQNGSFNGNSGRPASELTFNGKYTDLHATLLLTATALGSGATIGTFTVNVYVVNEIVSISCGDDPNSPRYYTGTDLLFELDTVSGTGKYPETTNALSSSEWEFTLAYYYGGEYVDFDEIGSGNNRTFRVMSSGEYKQVFKFNGNEIYAVGDPFLIAYEAGIKLDKIRITYKLCPRSHVVQELYECYRTYDIIRHVDSVALYEDNDYVKEVAKDAQGYIYELNQGESGAVFVSGIIMNGGEKIIVSDKSLTLSKTEGVYIRAPQTIGLSQLDGDKFKDVKGNTKSDAYTSITFVGPDVINENGDTYSGISIYKEDASGTPTLVKVTVKNSARPIESIGLYQDASCDRALTELDFGRFTDDTSSPYVKTLYVKIEYVRITEENTGKYVYFASATLVLPEYLQLALVNGTVGEYKGGGIYEFRNDVSTTNGPDGILTSNVDDETVVYIQECSVKLVPESAKYADGEGDGDRIQLSYSAQTVNAKAMVGTGVASISYTVDQNTQNSEDGETTDIKFPLLMSASDEKSVKVPFAVNSYASADGFGSIEYKLSKLSVSGATMNGITFTYSTDSRDMYLMFAINKNEIRNIAGETFTVTFTDSMRMPARQITVTFKITVESDIYAIDSGSYSFVTNGKDGDAAPQSVQIKYNGGNVSLQPSSALISEVTAAIYTLGDGTYSTYVGDVRVSGENGVFSITVKNTVLSGKYYLGLTYGGKTYYAPITVTTSSEEIELEKGGDYLDVTNAEVNGRSGDASVTVKTAGDIFTLPARVVNRGTNEPSGKTVTYKLYNSSARTSEMTGEDAVAKIDQYGKITFVKPSSYSGTLYYRAEFYDAGREELRYIDVDIEYTIAISSVTVSGVLGGIMSDDTITLYYAQSGAYTQLDLTNFITVGTPFAGVAAPETTIITLTPRSASLTANGKILVPNGAGEVMLDVSAADGINTVKSTYRVNIVALEKPQLSTSKDEINVVKNEESDISATVRNYTGLSYTFDIASYDSDMFTVVKTDTKGSEKVNVKVNRSHIFDGSEYAADKTYSFTVKITYSNDGTSATVEGGASFAVTQTITLGLDWQYDELKFEIYSEKSNDQKKLAGSDSNEPVEVTYDADTKYYVRIVTTDVNALGWYESGDWTYSASDRKGIVSIGAFSSDSAEITIDNKFGTATIAVEAEAYGKTTTATRNITFNYGGMATSSLSVSTDGGGSYGEALELSGNKGKLEIDFGTPVGGGTAVKARKIRYDIDASTVGVDVSASDIKVLYGGNVTPDGGKVTVQSAGGNKFYVVFTAEHVTTFTVSSSIVVGGRTYYMDTLTLELTATEPEITATVKKGGTDVTEIMPDETAQFGATVEQDKKFVGAYTVSYEIVDGGDYADIVESTGVLTPKKNNAENQRIVVLITVKITDGALIGSYTLEKSIIIVGIPLPDMVIKNTAKWKDNSTTIAIGETLSFAGVFELSSVTVGEGHTYHFNSVEYKYEFKAPNGYTAGDYGTTDNSLTVKDPEGKTTRAGGTFTLTVTATILSGSGINVDKKIVRTYYIFVVPKANAVSGVSISAQHGSYDVYTAVSLNTNDTAEYTDRIKSTDKYTVSYELANGTTQIPGIDKTIQDVVSVAGRAVTLHESLAVSGVNVILKPTVTMTTGVYAGMSFGGDDVTIALNGFMAEVKTVEWSNDQNKYPDVYLKDYITTALASKLPQELAELPRIIEVKARTYTSFVWIIDRSNGTADAHFAIEKTINVKKPGENDPAVVELEFVISFTGSSVEYFGKGSVAVGAIHPDVAVVLNPAASSNDDTHPVDLIAGGSLSVSMTEKHGLDILDVEVQDLGEYLSSANSGANIIITAADVTDSQEQTVKIVYSVRDLTSTFDIDGEYSIKISISPRMEGDAFTVTNERVTVATSKKWVSYKPSSGNAQNQTVHGFVSEWIASKDNDYKYPYSLTLRPSTGYISSVVAYVKVEAYETVGSVSPYGTTEYVVSGYSSATVNLSQTIRAKAAERVVITFGMAATSTAQFTVQYQSRNGSASNSASTTMSKIYAVSFSSSTVPVYLDKNAPDATLDSTTANVAYNGTYANIPSDSSHTPERTGYEFKGWYFDKEGEKQATGSLPGYSSTVYAKWQAKTYQVEFNYGGGKVGQADKETVTETFGQAYVLPDVEPTREGYTFAGWYSGPQRITSNRTVPADPQTVTAQWTAETYVVTFDGNGVELDDFVKTKTVTYAAEYGALPVLSRVGYKFDGWYTTATDSDGATGKKVNATDHVETARAHTLFARWIAETYTVTLDPAGGTLGDSQTKQYKVAYDTEYPAMGNSKPTRAGYAFGGWYTQPNGGGKQITNNEGALIEANKAFNVAYDHTLYAYWTANEYTVTLSGGTGATVTVKNADGTPTNTATVRVTYDGTYAILADVTATRPGYTFVEWHDASGNVVTKDTKVTITDNDTTLTAVWKEVLYTVTLNAGEGTIGSVHTLSVQMKTGDTFVMHTMVTPTREGYRFEGWFENEQNQGTDKKCAETITVGTKDIVLYAHWAQLFEVSFDLNYPEDFNGNKSQSFESQFYADGDLCDLPEPTDSSDEYEFDGWYTDKEAGQKITDGSELELSDDLPLYARWSKKDNG